ncbi:hypothetical protein GCM10027411_01850 [Microbacterium aureliae]
MPARVAAVRSCTATLVRMSSPSDASRIFRRVRAISGGTDAPWPGMLCHDAEGERVHVVDAATLPADWAGWRAEADGHLLAPHDVVRRPGGHDVVLPACDETVAGLLDRRARAGIAIGAGEAVTLAVSALRALAELRDAPEEPGQWWVAADGRPLLAAGVGDDPARASCLALLDRLRGDVALACWDEVRQAAGADRLSGLELARAEDALFDEAEPAPLVLAVPAPRLAASARRDEPMFGGEPAAEPWTGRLVRHVDADLADLVSKATTGLWRRAGRPPGSRRPWALAGAAAGVVVVAGMMWPAPGEPSAAEPAVRASPTESAPHPHQTPPVTETDAGDAEARARPGDSVAIGDRLVALLTARRACEGDVACLAGIQDDPARTLPAGPIDEPADRLAVQLVDDLGDVVILQVAGTDGRRQLVVMARQNERWLLRDVHDVAQQP